ncbi:MAG TPA: ABC transporter permease [Aggregatilineales bacterium]|nr:ABC transporter permease [Chloroflexota bacterium]HOA24429.1 ABC transporter permease [Aggregatilineales bacterium]HPV06231.1 ABC transporter permease [Aggregatilineales bacterium]HQA66873.1 ABC transporter permease [Aggregatilineales bacterium]HQE17474.1 ABC transporter permease [Aggregatilineales bacterium]
MLRLRKLFARHEMLIALIIVVFSLIVGAINPRFFSVANAFSLVRSATIMGVFSMGALIVIISGGIDVSFPGIAVAAAYTTTELLVNWGYDGESMLLPFALSGFLGLLMGLINAFFIARFKLPTFIVTLGTLSLFRGAMLFFVGSDYYNARELPISIRTYSAESILTVETARGTTSLHPTIFILIAIALLTWFVLRYTMLGRGIYAIGGDREAAERAGFNINRTQWIIYAFVGLNAGIGGMIVTALFRQANPFALVGTELEVIAAVVLGGAALTGGRGTVIGSLLGVILITMVNNSLILLGIPSDWQRLVVGFLILIGAGIPLLRARLTERRIAERRRLEAQASRSGAA